MRIDEQVEEVVDAAVRFALAGARPDPERALDYLYAGSVPPRRGRAAVAGLDQVH
jgi:TPP-dependent pyruvate/acetoin dehydrogenase alpha subunit